MATESSRKMGGENLSLRKRFEAHGVAEIPLSPGLTTLRVCFPLPLAAGPLHGEMCLENGDSMSTI